MTAPTTREIVLLIALGAISLWYLAQRLTLTSGPENEQPPSQATLKKKKKKKAGPSSN